MIKNKKYGIIRHNFYLFKLLWKLFRKDKLIYFRVIKKTYNNYVISKESIGGNRNHSVGLSLTFAVYEEKYR